MDNLSLIKETKYILEKLGHNPRKRFGQNFLISENILKKIVEEANISKDDLIIEIGPGIGSLTKYLLDYAGDVISIEIDNDLASFLEERFKLYNNFQLINLDVLKVDLDEIIKKSGKKRENIKVVANLPYYITTPIITSLFGKNIYSVTVMVQKEVAERFTVKNLGKERSNITYVIEYNADAEILFNVSRNNFMPAPKVDSSIINLKLRTDKDKKDIIIKSIMELDLEKLNLSEENILNLKDENIKKIADTCMDIIKCGFMHKRKKMITSLSMSGIYDKSKTNEILNILQINENIRPEKLYLNEYVKIAFLYLFL